MGKNSGNKTPSPPRIMSFNTEKERAKIIINSLLTLPTTVLK